MTIRLKSNNVRPGTHLGLMFAVLVAQSVYDEYDIEMVITSLNDSNHSETSLHYSDQAIDLRTRNIPNVIGASTIAKEIEDRLNHHYDVILESDHIHIEYQPRK